MTCAVITLDKCGAIAFEDERGTLPFHSDKMGPNWLHMLSLGQSTASEHRYLSSIDWENGFACSASFFNRTGLHLKPNAPSWRRMAGSTVSLAHNSGTSQRHHTQTPPL